LVRLVFVFTCIAVLAICGSTTTACHVEISILARDTVGAVVGSATSTRWHCTILPGETLGLACNLACAGMLSGLAVDAIVRHLGREVFVLSGHATDAVVRQRQCCLVWAKLRMGVWSVGTTAVHGSNVRWGWSRGLPAINSTAAVYSRGRVEFMVTLRAYEVLGGPRRGWF